MSERRYLEGEAIFRSGDTADGVFRVRSGEVRLSRPDGAETTVGEGAIFGVAGVLAGGAREVDAVAAGAVAVDFLHAREVLSLLSSHADLLHVPLLAIFAELDAAAAARLPPPDAMPADSVPAEPMPAERASEEDPGASGVDPPGPPPLRIRLIPDGKRIRELLGADEIVIDRLPFRIGRKAEDAPASAYRDVDLALEDTRPFSLSRRHVSIEMRNGELVVRDCGSYHGTLAGGMDLSSDWRGRIVQLGEGETELIAGGPQSPFRFRIVVG